MRRGNERLWARFIFYSLVLASIVSLMSFGLEVSLAQDGRVTLSRGQRADGARLTELARFAGMIGSARGRAADRLRFTAMADHLLMSGNDACDPLLVATRAQRAEADRLTGLAEWHAKEPMARIPVLHRGRAADSLRLASIASDAAIDEASEYKATLTQACLAMK